MTTSSRELFELLRVGATGREQALAMSFVRPDGAVRGYSYGELFDTAEQFGARLPASLGGGPIGILVDSQEQQVLHYLAVLAAGRIPAILSVANRKMDPDYHARTMNSMLRHIRFDALISDIDGVQETTGPVLAPGTLAVRAGGDRAVSREHAVDGVAFVQFSSGSTGMKKGVPIGAAAVAAQLSAYGAAISLDPSDVIVSWLPLYHDMGFITALHLPLRFGAHTVMIHPVDWVTKPGLWFAFATAYRGTLSWHPNFAYQFMTDRVREIFDYDLSSMRGLANCSEPATYRAQVGFARAFAPAGLQPDVFMGCYAMAETTFAVTHGADTSRDGLDFTGPARGPSVPKPVPSVGRAIEGADIIVEGPDGQIAAERELGELVVRAPYVASGYFANPEESAASFRDGRYHTGDLGYRVNDRIYVTGRRKDLIIVAGHNIHPGDVEELVSAEPGVRPGRVVAFSVYDHPTQTERVIILLEPAGGRREVSVATIRRHLVSALGIANFEVHVVARGWLVKSSSGKMARLVSRDKWLAAPRGGR